MQKIKILLTVISLFAVVIILGVFFLTIDLNCMKKYGHLPVPIKGSVLNGCDVLTNQGWVPIKEFLK